MKKWMLYEMKGELLSEGVAQSFIQLCRNQLNLNITKYLRKMGSTKDLL